MKRLFALYFQVKIVYYLMRNNYDYEKRLKIFTMNWKDIYKVKRLAVCSASPLFISVTFGYLMRHA